MRPDLRPLVWLGGSKKDLKALPAEVQDVFKKSRSGIATPQQDIELIKRRLKDAATLQRKEPSK